MARWAAAVEPREQMVLFARRLEDAIPAEHSVRYLDEILGRLNWSHWEAKYHVRLGQPAIHPRVLSGVLLYGLLTRIRSSRGLEEALQVRLDFRWLAEGRSIDHTTLSEFRREHPSELKTLFLQICELARELGLLSLQRWGYDGTRVRADNRRKGTRTPAQLQQERAELAAKFEEELAQAEREDGRDEELFGLAVPHQVPAELRDAQRRVEKIDAALRALQTTGATAERIPVTDLDARIMPNKDGGFAANYTPATLVDIDSGLIVATTVLNVVNEDKQLLPLVDAACEQFQLASPPAVLADGLMASGANIAGCEERGIAFYSPPLCPLPDPAANPALRADPTQPVPAAEYDRLPQRTLQAKGETRTQFDKTAFVYDAERDCYWCPTGKPLHRKRIHTEERGSTTRTRTSYQAEKAACAGCVLKDRCLPRNTAAKQIYREQFEEEHARHAQHMAQPASQAIYKRRSHAVERPFAVIKQHFGLRRFLLRGLDRVRTEWSWATAAFNLSILLAFIRGRAGPALK